MASGIALQHSAPGRSAVVARLTRLVRFNGPLSMVCTTFLAFIVFNHRLIFQIFCAEPGKMLQFVVLLSVLGATLATVRQKMINTVRACGCCHGYGIQR